MLLTLEASFSFWALHHIDEHPQPHGHAYRLTVYLRGDTETGEPPGMVIPLDELGIIVSRALRPYQGANLNDLVERPTLERIAQHLARKLAVLVPSLTYITLQREYDTAVTVEVSP